MAQQQQQRSHVPKFGNWDGDNVPYTACFENARKEKAGSGGVRINPNDPEQNPNAFNAAHLLHHRHILDQYTLTTAVSESSTDKSPSNSSANSVVNPTHQRKKSEPNKPVNHAADDFSGRAAVSVPKFGAWDDKDPRSAEGFTVIFNKVKEEKQITSGKFPSVPPRSNIDVYDQINQSKETRSWRCCCFCCCLF